MSQLELERLSFGVGDRFAHQAKAQLRAFLQLAEQGVHAAPVWNKSNREHQFIGSTPDSVQSAAAAAVAELQWDRPWHVDADHIGMDTVGPFLDCSDFFTIDVADAIGAPPSDAEVDAFVSKRGDLIGAIEIEGLDSAIQLSEDDLRRVLRQYMQAAQLAGEIYRKIAEHKGEGAFIAEVSMDETDAPQTPPELLVILALLAEQGVRVQTIAPKFTGRFNKGVDYVGDLKQFETEFRDDLAVIAYAVRTFGLPGALKLSVHSGSDKFSLYPVIGRALRDTGAGLHIKTAGTTWLEELIGLAESEGEGLRLAKEIYAEALTQQEALCGPYATVIDIDPDKLPDASAVNDWTGEQFVNALRHIPDHPEFNASFRQLLHIAFKLAAKQGDRYLDLLKSNEAIVGKNVTENIFERHMRPLFLS